jgi:putative ABC transport system substrate-binding protein
LRKRNNRDAPFFPILLFLVGFFSFGSCLPVSFADSKPRLVGVLISQEIRPFILMVEGLESQLDAPTLRIFLDQEGKPYSQDPRFEKLVPDAFTLVVAVGPRALSFLVDHHWPPPLIFGMILNPERIAVKNDLCGVSLNLSEDRQFKSIRDLFPDINKVGVLFDPRNNEEWFAAARPVAAIQGISLVAVTVSSRSAVSGVIKEKAPDVDALLFIPDPTVISKTIIQYVIKEALLRRVPSIGYNPFFTESGAALSFVIDYRHVGERVARQVRQVLDGKPCSVVAPDFRVMLNRSVIRTLKIKLGTPLPENVEGD